MHCSNVCVCVCVCARTCGNFSGSHICCLQDAPSVSCLPKGILHGCVKCENCQKVCFQ